MNNFSFRVTLIILVSCSSLSVYGMTLRQLYQRSKYPRSMEYRRYYQISTPPSISSPTKQLSWWKKMTMYIPLTKAHSIRFDAKETFDHVQAMGRAIIRNEQTGALQYSNNINDPRRISQQEFIEAKLMGEKINNPEVQSHFKSRITITKFPSKE